jgi:diaminopimelate decarboxylase
VSRVAHPAGSLHGEFEHRPSWLRPPADVNALVPQLWAANVARGDDGVMRVGGLDVRDIAREFGTPAYVLDESDFRARCREFRDAFAGADVYYATKAFVCTALVRWLAEEGLGIDASSGGELAYVLRAGLPDGPRRVPRQQQVRHELERAVSAGWAASSSTPTRRSPGSPPWRLSTECGSA